MNKLASELNNYFYFLLFLITIEFLTFTIKNSLKLLKPKDSTIFLKNELLNVFTIFFWDFFFAIFLRKGS